MRYFIPAVIIVAQLLFTAKTDTALWIARSCVGEAGFSAVYTGECAAIAHIYRKRALISGASYYRTMRQYSAAIKLNRGKIWVLSLSRDGRRPHGWGRADWMIYREKWLDTLHLADSFMRGDISDPLPPALHYGGKMDIRLNLKLWERMHTPHYRNIFYKRRSQ